MQPKAKIPRRRRSSILRKQGAEINQQPEGVFKERINPSPPRKVEPKNGRAVLDYYPTAPVYTQLLLRECPYIEGVCFDMCVGYGHIIKVLAKEQRIPKAFGYDLMERPAKSPKHLWDALDPKYYDDKPPFDWGITCPPFGEGVTVLQNAYKHATRGCAFLLRLSFLEPCKSRYKWLNENKDQLRKMIPTSPRGHFRRDRDKPDSITVGWFVFDKSFSYAALGLDCPFTFYYDQSIPKHYKDMKEVHEFGSQDFYRADA